MRKMLIKSLSCLFAASMLLTACSGNNSKNSSDTQSKSAENKTQINADGTKTYEPKTIKILGSVETAYWDTRENQPVFKKMQELLASINLTIKEEAVAKEQYADVLKTRTAAALDLPDLINITSMSDADAINLGKVGIFQDVKPLVEKYSNGNVAKLQEEYLPNFWGPTIAEDGKSYWFPCWYKATCEGTKPFSSAKTALIRKDWLDKLKLPMPTTADEFVAALEKMRKEDVNGSGKEDEVMLYSPGFDHIAPLFGLPGEDIAVDVNDHTAKSPWLMKDQLVPYLEFLKTLVDKKILDTEALDKPGEYSIQKVKSNCVSAQAGYAATDFYSDPVKEYGGNYDGVFFKGNPNAEQYVQGELPDFVFDKMAITKECKDPEAVVRLLDLITTPEFAILHRYGIEGDMHTVVDGVLVPSKKLGVRDEAIAGHAVGHDMWAQMYGSLALEQWESMRTAFTDKPEILDAGDNHSTGDHKYHYNGYALAIQTEAEVENELKYKTDLDTYMKETITKMALGQYKIEDLDKHVAKMKDLGLETLLADAQARHNRFIGK